MASGVFCADALRVKVRLLRGTQVFFTVEAKAASHCQPWEKRAHDDDGYGAAGRGDDGGYEQRRVEAGGREVHLTPIEYKILLLLIANRGKVLTHHYILKEIWGYAEGVEAATLRVFMATLRRKIEQNPSQPQHIITEVGVGYRFK